MRGFRRFLAVTYHAAAVVALLAGSWQIALVMIILALPFYVVVGGIRFLKWASIPYHAIALIALLAGDWEITFVMLMFSILVQLCVGTMLFIASLNH